MDKINAILLIGAIAIIIGCGAAAYSILTFDGTPVIYYEYSIDDDGVRFTFSELPMVGDIYITVTTPNGYHGEMRVDSAHFFRGEINHKNNTYVPHCEGYRLVEGIPPL